MARESSRKSNLKRRYVQTTFSWFFYCNSCHFSCPFLAFWIGNGIQVLKRSPFHSILVPILVSILERILVPFLVPFFRPSDLGVSRHLWKERVQPIKPIERLDSSHFHPSACTFFLCPFLWRFSFVRQMSDSFKVGYSPLPRPPLRDQMSIHSFCASVKLKPKGNPTPELMG